MNKTFIKPEKMNEYGMDEKIYNHYYERKIHPVAKPKTFGPIIDGVDVGELRYVNEHPTWPITEVAEKEIVKTNIDYINFRAKHYRPKDLNKSGPCVFFVHGGGFCYNTIEIYDPACSRLAELIDGVVVSIGYTLSPEAKFPTALKQAYYTIERMLSEKDKWLIDPDKVIIMGDSAGGNLAASLSAYDRENKYIKMQVLYYPTVDSTNYSTDKFDMSWYGENVCELAQDKINQLYKSSVRIRGLYLKEDEDRTNELVSPLFTKDFAALPYTVMFTAEYDFLTRQAEEYAQKVEDAGVKVDYYKCLGTFHGYLERIGFFDQGDVTLKILAEKIKEYFK